MALSEKPYIVQGQLGNLIVRKDQPLAVSIPRLELTVSAAAQTQIDAKKLAIRTYGNGPWGYVLAQFKNCPINITYDGSTSGYGSLQLGTWPREDGDVLRCGAHYHIDPGSVSAQSYAGNLVMAVGTAAATAGATLTGTEADYLASSVVFLTAGVGNGSQVKTSGVTVAGAAGAVDLFLNIAGTNTVIGADGIVLFTGFISFLTMWYGDHTDGTWHTTNFPDMLP